MLIFLHCWPVCLEYSSLSGIFFLIYVFLFAFYLVLVINPAQDTSSDERWLKARARQLQSVEEEIISKYNLLPSGETGDDFITLIPFQILSWRPRALYYPAFLTAEQCQHIINMAKPSLQPSTLALRKGETAETTRGIRTSSGMFVLSSEDQTGVLQVIEEKIARATMVPRTHGEAFNVLRYEIGQKYDAHYDAFNPEEYGPQTSQRVATFLLYLSNFEEGGETTFPLENDENFEGYDAQKCNGLRVKPNRGDAIVFYSTFPNNTIDPASLHASCHVIKGGEMGGYQVDQRSSTSLDCLEELFYPRFLLEKGSVPMPLYFGIDCKKWF
ncbi:hypothetical protein OIU78_028674 [Salix suchowensis]|nr:hypothetical protein OIU78_028674 [Salix suchowensis]